MDNLFKLVDERVSKYLTNSPFVIAVPCVVVSVLDDEMVTVKLISNNTSLTVPNWSGSPVSVGENVQLFYRGNILTERTAYIGASLNKSNGGISPTHLKAETAIGALLETERVVAEIDVRNLSDTILLIFNANVQGDSASEGNGVFKIYIDDEEQSYSPLISTAIGGYTHLSFTLPFGLEMADHNIKVAAYGENATIVSIDCSVYGKIVSAEPPFDPTGDGDYIFIIDDNEATVWHYIGSSQYPAVPIQLGGADTKVLGATSFNYTNVKNVYIPEGITEIE